MVSASGSKGSKVGQPLKKVALEAPGNHMLRYQSDGHLQLLIRSGVVALRGTMYLLNTVDCSIFLTLRQLG